MTFNNADELIQYAKDKAKKRAYFKSKVYNTPGVLIILYKSELRKIYEEIKCDLRNGNIKILDNSKNSKLIRTQKKQK